MEWINQFVWYSETVLLVVTLVFTAQWKKKTGQPLLVAALACILATHVFLHVRYWLIKAKVMDWSSPPGLGMSIVATAAGMAFNILLLLYVLRIFQEKSGTVDKDTVAPADVGSSSISSPEMTIGRALFSFDGRMCRADYWLKGVLPMLPFGLLNNILFYVVHTNEAMAFAAVIGVLSLWPGLALIVKRLHDRNHSGWYALMMLIPIVGPFIIMIEVAFLRGTVGPNRFGGDLIKDSQP
ncbi:MAG: DUF805 domain-containing protein [Chitinispirillaceae bacterium]|nr:DUF805 domain-containing protein [Chitinispirillaceae bacterium]